MASLVYCGGMAKSFRLAPSILSADFGRLAEEVADVEEAGIQVLHVDVMDGNFVPNITIGPLVVKALKRITSLHLDVHLMIAEPDRYLGDFAKAGADTLTVHVEACVHLQRALRGIRDLGVRSAVALNPHTHESALDYVLEDLDQVLVMSVNPGFGGQSFIPSQLAKLERIATRVSALGLDIDLEVDGGVGPQNIRSVVDAGANLIVAGTAIFGQKDRKAAVSALKSAV